MELLDIVDENNELTGEVEERTIAHRDGLWHRHVSCFIMNLKGEILLQKRSSDRDRNPNMWAKTGGHIASLETVKEALLREINEELGINPEEKNLEFTSVYKNNDTKKRGFCYEYIVIVDKTIDEYRIQKEELSEVKYFTIEEIEQRVKEKDMSFTFTTWDDQTFNEKIKMLKSYRKKLR